MSGRKIHFEQGQIYHVYNRGNHREMIFRDNRDRVHFLSKLDEYADKHPVSVLVFCLMDNHFHLILRKEHAPGLTRMMHALLTSYVKSHTKRYGLVGRLFQERFQARLIPDEGVLAYVSRYVHLNPSSFADYRTYRWSSYRQYAAASSLGMCDVGPILDIFGGSKDSYAIYVEKGLKPGLTGPKAIAIIQPNG